MRIIALITLLAPTVASAQWVPTHEFQGGDFCMELVDLHTPLLLGGVCLSGVAHSWDWQSDAFPQTGFRVMGLPQAPNQGPMATAYTPLTFDTANTAPIPPGLPNVYAVDRCTNTQCVEVLYLHADGNTLTWWAAAGLGGAPALTVNVGDELVFTPLATAPIPVAPVLTQFPL